MPTTDTRTASRMIADEVGTWPDVTSGYGRRGELAFRVGRREIGHLHGDHAAHFSFPKDVWTQLHDAARIVHHPVFPGRVGPAARHITGAADIRDVIALLRLNYDRITAPRPPGSGASSHEVADRPGEHRRGDGSAGGPGPRHVD